MSANVGAPQLQSCWKILAKLRIGIPPSTSLILTESWLIQNAITCFACGILLLDAFCFWTAEKVGLGRCSSQSSSAIQWWSKCSRSRLRAILPVLCMIMMAVFSMWRGFKFDPPFEGDDLLFWTTLGHPSFIQRVKDLLETLVSDCRQILDVDASSVFERRNENRSQSVSDLDPVVLVNLKRYLIQDYSCLSQLWSLGILDDEKFALLMFGDSWFTS